MNYVTQHAARTGNVNSTDISIESLLYKFDPAREGLENITIGTEHDEIVSCVSREIRMRCKTAIAEGDASLYRHHVCDFIFDEAVRNVASDIAVALLHRRIDEAKNLLANSALDALLCEGEIRNLRVET